MDLARITPLVLTHDEAPNIGRMLAALSWAEQIVVVDSGSTDGTLDILTAHPAVTTHRRAFDDFAAQCNYGLSVTRTEWVLSLDADYVIPQQMVEEMRALDPDPETAGYRARFRYFVDGKPLRGSLYPPRVVLYRRDSASYVADGHGHRVRVQGIVRDLSSRIAHDDRKPLARWLDNQRRYARQEADKLLADGAMSVADRLRRAGWGPILMPLYCLFVRGLILDGRAGWRYTLERTYAELLLALELAERRRPCVTRGREGDRA